jgi:hypothetical protein
LSELFSSKFGMLMNHPPVMGAEGPKTTDLGAAFSDSRAM